jgi:hypothetical protein
MTSKESNKQYKTRILVTSLPFVTTSAVGRNSTAILAYRCLTARPFESILAAGIINEILIFSMSPYIMITLELQLMRNFLVAYAIVSSCFRGQHDMFKILPV